MATNFQMGVVNGTNWELDNVVLTHICDNDAATLYLPSIGPYKTSDTIPVNTYDGHNDYYLIQFTAQNPDGAQVYQANCYCNSDSSSTWVQLGIGGDTYQVKYNDTGCTDKSYSYITST